MLSSNQFRVMLDRRRLMLMSISTSRDDSKECF